jgi:hypothetical protein
MSELLETTTLRHLFTYKTSPISFKLCIKIKHHLLVDVLPTLLIASILGGLTLKAAEYIDQHRQNQHVSFAVEK